MTKKQAKLILYSKTPRTSEELMEAILALGTSQKQIKSNLLKMGFKNYNQRDPLNCPVCQYLKSLGIESPFIDVDKAGFGEDIRVYFNENRKLSAMGKFQNKAAVGAISEFATGRTETERSY